MTTNAFDDLSRIPQDSSSEPTEALHVAQAETPAATSQPAPVKTVIEVASDLTLTLPAGASIDQPRVNGTDLEFVQPDGSVIVVPNGALTGLTIVVGDVTIPAEAVATIFSANNIETAAGPEGAGLPSSGGNFATPVPGIGDGLPLIDLLGNTDFSLGSPELEDLEDGFAFRASVDANRPPSFIDDGDDNGLGIAGLRLKAVSEEVVDDPAIPGKENGNEVSSTPSNPDSVGDPDTVNASISSGKLTVEDPDGDFLTFVLGVPSTSLTSHGTPVLWSGDGTNQLVGTANGVPVITITITNGTTATDGGNYSVVLSGPIDHPKAGVEDSIDLKFTVTVSDGKGGVDTTTLILPIEDDSPEPTLVENVRGGEGGDPLILSLDETVQPDGPRSNSYDRGASNANGGSDDVGSQQVYNRTPVISTNPAATAAIGHQQTGTGVLNNLVTGTPNYGADGPGTESVSFALKLSAANLATNLLVTKLAGTALETLSRNIVLVEVNGAIEGRIGGDNVAFRIYVDASNPADPRLAIDQFLPIQHGNTASLDDSMSLLLTGGSLSLQVTYTATDFDSDSKSLTREILLSGGDTSLIRFDDDGPEVKPGNRQTALITVDEDGLHGAAGELSTANIDAGRPGEQAGNNSAIAIGNAGALNALVDFGLDGPNANGAFELVATPTPVEIDVYSKGQRVVVVVDGGVLHGYTEYGTGNVREIFTLSVGGDGSYVFTLKDQVDHPAPPQVALPKTCSRAPASTSRASSMRWTVTATRCRSAAASSPCRSSTIFRCSMPGRPTPPRRALSSRSTASPVVTIATRC